MQTYFNNTLLIGFTFLIGMMSVCAQDIPKTNTFPKTTKLSKRDTIKPNTIKQDSIKTDTVKVTKQQLLEDIVKDKAKDYKEVDLKKQISTLYNEAELYYQDIELKAGIIIIDYKKNLAYAKGIVDSTGVYTQKPNFKQADQETTQDSLVYNFKTKKAIVFGVRTEQQGMYIDALMTKRVNDSTMYMSKAEITTSKGKKKDYHIATKNVKFIPNKKAVGGLSQLFIADVPTPVILPFFFVPLTKGRSSGLLLPTYGENRNGYFLQNGGFYFAISDYVDLAVTGDMYTNGSWGLRFDSNYKLRYQFGGRFGLRMENLINGKRGLSEYSKTNSFHVNWSHNQDTKSSPNSRFSASVNFGSSKYFKQSLNELSTPNFLKNNLSSSISYYKKFVGTPFNMNLALTHSQNTNTEQISMSLPNLSVGMDRLYPFAPKDGAKKNAIHNIGLSYSMAMQNQIQTTDEDFLKSDMFKKAKSGLKHNLSLSTSIKALKYINLSPSLSYRDVWYLKTLDKKWNSTSNKVEIDTINGFKTFRDYSGSVSASTTFYGTFKFKKGRMNAIRHTVIPSVSYGYSPDFNFYYEDVQNDVLGNTSQYSAFDGGAYGTPNKNMSQSLSFALRNTFEAKLKDRDSTKTEFKKLSLLNNLNFNSSYNMETDSMRWAPVRMSASTMLFKKMNVNISAIMDPYAITSGGTRINTFNINNGGSLFRLTNANLVTSYSLNNDTFKKNKSTTTDGNQPDDDGQFGGDLKNNRNSTQNSEKDRTKKVSLYKLDIPWSLSLNYSLGYSNRNRENEISTNTLRFNGNISLTPKWDVNFSSGYDFKGDGLSYTTLGFARDLNSWRMTFNWTPIGNNATYYFFIGVKSSVLSDLKYDRHLVPDKRLF